MADIELVIKIPQEVYEDIKNGADIEIYYGEHIVVKDDWASERIRNGKPLPKGYGRLIDADALKKDDEVTEWLSINPIRTGKMLSQFSKLFVKKIDDAPTIIEADKESEDT